MDINDKGPMPIREVRISAWRVTLKEGIDFSKVCFFLETLHILC